MFETTDSCAIPDSKDDADAGNKNAQEIRMPEDPGVGKIVTGPLPFPRKHQELQFGSRFV